ncbi:MAG: DinB family protein [Phycisphaerae bacterium]
MLGLLIENSTANTKMLQRFVADIPEEKMCVQFPGLVNHPMWVIGHLAQARAGMMGLLGQKADLPADWPTRFGRNSVPVADAGAYSRREEMIGILLRVHEELVGVLKGADDAALDAANPLERLAALFPTKRHLIWNVLTTHDGIHLGQIADFRRALGMKPVI